MKFLWPSSVCCLGVLALVGCDAGLDPGSETTTSAGSVEIVSINPPASSSLDVGSDYVVEVEVEYSFNATEGEIGLVLQRAESGHPPIEHVLKPVSKGEGSLSFRVEITVPNTKAIQIFTPLTAEGDTSTSVVAMRSYTVVDNRE